MFKQSFLKMKSLLVIICIVCCVSGDTLKLSKVSGMQFTKTSLDASEVSNYLLELLGVKVDRKFASAVVEDPFDYATVLVMFEDGGSLDCLPSYVIHKIREAIDWSEVEDSLKVAFNETLGRRAAFYESPQKPQKGQQSELLKSSLATQQKELENIKKKISGVPISKTIVWFKTKPQELAKQYCDIIQDFMKASYNKVLVGFVSKDPVSIHRKRTLLQTDEVKPKATEVVFNTSRDFPVIFTIVAVVVLIFFISVLVVSYGVAKMDPGRDSIIYRMTSQRMKKEQ